MRRRCVATAGLALTVMALPIRLLAQGLARVPRVGILYFTAPAPGAELDLRGFGRGMRELGYVEGRNVSIVFRGAAGRPERLDALAAELAQMKLDVILAGGPGPLAALRRVTDATAIVAVSGSDPVGEGWAASLSRPGGNVTGLSVTFPEFGPKRLELAQQALPGVGRVAILLAPAELPRRGADDVATMSAAAQRLGLRLQVLEASEPADIERAMAQARDGHAQALLTVDTTLVVAQRPRIAAIAAQERLPVIGEFGGFGVEGLLLAYGADIDDLLRRAASYVDRILKGARAGDLPVERPSKLALVVNRKVARELGISLPASLLARADRIVG